MNELHIGRFELNSQKQELLFHTSNGSVIKRKLSFRESSILQLLIEANGELVESHILLIEFWGSDTIYNMNSLYVFMSRMKRVLEADPTLSIINARGIGYRLIQQSLITGFLFSAFFSISHQSQFMPKYLRMTRRLGYLILSKVIMRNG